MNKSDLMREIAKKMSISQKDSLRFINIFEDVMANELLKDGSIMRSEERRVGKECRL